VVVSLVVVVVLMMMMMVLLLAVRFTGCSQPRCAARFRLHGGARRSPASTKRC
jgi:hypothetical protein